MFDEKQLSNTELAILVYALERDQKDNTRKKATQWVFNQIYDKVCVEYNKRQLKWEAFLKEA